MRTLGIDVIERELVGERAGALGRIAQRMEQALVNLRQFDHSGNADPAARAELFEIAAESVWFYVVQREALGLNRHAEVLRHYDVPAEVSTRMGPRPRGFATAKR